MATCEEGKRERRERRREKWVVANNG